MNFKKPIIRSQPEQKGARGLRKYMETRGWITIKLHGNKYQIGLPDLLCMHSLYGIKFIETKAPGGKLRMSQHKMFATFASHGVEVYVCEDYTHYYRIFSKLGNWRNYVRIG